MTLWLTWPRAFQSWSLFGNTDHVYPPNSKVLNVDSTKNTIKPTYDASNDVNLKTSAQRRGGNTNPVASR